MSLIGTRKAIADALSMVDGVTGYPFPPSVTREGDGWPVGPVLDRDTGTAFMAVWRIHVVTPVDEQAAAEWFDRMWPPLFYALSPVVFVERAAPIKLSADQGNTLLAVEITAHAEE